MCEYAHEPLRSPDGGDLSMQTMPAYRLKQEISQRKRRPRSSAPAPFLLISLFFATGAWAQGVTPRAVFGPDVFVFGPSTPPARMQAKINEVYARQQHSEFGMGRYAFVFLPGQYALDVPIGFYTEVLGAGRDPDAVRITGDVHVDAAGPSNNATTTFWRAAEGFSVVPTVSPMRWAVSQAVSFRRMHVLGAMVLNQNHGWASGGWMADTVVDGGVDSGTQQQWMSRNTEWGSWKGSNWNMVFVGVKNPPAGGWPSPPFTKVARTPVVREKPFLVSDGHGSFSVVVPNLVRDTAGVGWHRGFTPGRMIPIGEFFIAQPGRDTAASINRQLAAGKNLLLTPGIYDLIEPLRVRRKDTVVLGLGFATLRPVAGTAAMRVADVDGVTISGLLFDAGKQMSPVLLEVGEAGKHLSHVDDPISLHDVFFRVGGADTGQTGQNLVIDSDDTIVDHTWIWRADHGSGVGWTSNLSETGLTVNGNRVTIYGLFVEHHQKYQVVWNGEEGRTYFYQSEIPYDPPTQAAWSSGPGKDGWASYKVADGVQRHEAWGLGIYSVFRHPDVNLAHAIETSTAPGIHFHDMITVALDNLGEIRHVINNTGAPATTALPRIDPKVTTFP
jgi:hypothetical protein